LQLMVTIGTLSGDMEHQVKLGRRQDYHSGLKSSNQTREIRLSLSPHRMIL
jgi:hypothetical protein